MALIESEFYKEELESKMRAMAPEEQAIMIQYVSDELLAAEWKRRFDEQLRKREEAIKEIERLDMHFNMLQALKSNAEGACVNESMA